MQPRLCINPLSKDLVSTWVCKSWLMPLVELFKSLQDVSTPPGRTHTAPLRGFVLSTAFVGVDPKIDSACGEGAASAIAHRTVLLHDPALSCSCLSVRVCLSGVGVGDDGGRGITYHSSK